MYDLPLFLLLISALIFAGSWLLFLRTWWRG
jgi:hypothetical protein